MYELRVQSHFSAAHALRQYGGDCEQLHGHNWAVEVRLEARELDRRGLAMDFREVKALLGEVLGALDHRFLNDLGPFRVENPSTERIAHYIYDALAPRLPAGVTLAEVTAWETPGCGATYRP
jgi:6-pyruvoyltetrahydropterin/6-carboxytetrahydropterin synthase